MQRVKLPETLSETLKEFVEHKKQAKEATNAVNRDKTKIRNFVKGKIQSKEWPLGTHVEYDGLRIDYDAAKSEVIEPESLMDLYEKNEISREDFLKCISVGKKAVETHIGSDVAIKLTQVTEGNRYDIRLGEMDIDQPKSRVVVIPSQERKLRRKTKVGDKAASKDKAKPAATTKRRVRLRDKDKK